MELFLILLQKKMDFFRTRDADDVHGVPGDGEDRGAGGSGNRAAGREDGIRDRWGI